MRDTAFGIQKDDISTHATGMSHTFQVLGSSLVLELALQQCLVVSTRVEDSLSFVGALSTSFDSGSNLQLVCATLLLEVPFGNFKSCEIDCHHTCFRSK